MTSQRRNTSATWTIDAKPLLQRREHYGQVSGDSRDDELVMLLDRLRSVIWCLYGSVF